MKTIILTLATATLIAIPTLAPARNESGTQGAPSAPTDGRTGRPQPDGWMKFMTDQLGLSAEQQEQVKAIYEKYAAQVKDLVSKGRENLTDEEKARVQAALRSQHEEVVALLDDTQKRKMEELRQQWRPAGGKNAAGDRRAKGPRKVDDAAPTDRPPNN